MKETSIQKIQLKAGNSYKLRIYFVAFMIISSLILVGCVHVKPHQQRLVSKPNMQFSGSVVFNYQDRLLSQFESSSASSIGGQSGSCSSCTAGGS